jgi:MFS family permease
MAGNKSSARDFYGWINLAVLAVVGVMGGLYIISFGYFLPFLIDDFGWNRSAASFAATINVIALGLCSPAAGIFIMKYGARRAILAGNLLGFAGFLLLFFHSHLWELFLGYGLLVGTGAGLGGMLATTTVVNNWFVKKRSKALGIFLGCGGFGGMFMGPAIVFLIENYGWRTAFLIMSLLVLLFAVILPAAFIRSKPQDLGQVPDGSESPKDTTVARKPVPLKASYKTPVEFTAGEALRTRSLWLLIAYFCMNMLTMNALMVHQVAYLVDIGISAGMAAFALSVMSGFMTFSQFGTGFFGMRFSMHSIAIGGELLKILGIVILVFTESLPFVFVYMIVLGLGFGAVFVATMNIFPNYFGAANYPKIMGFMRLFWAFVGGAGAPLAGFIRDETGSYLPAFQGVIAVAVLGLVCLIFATPPVHPSLKAAGEAETAETA